MTACPVSDGISSIHRLHCRTGPCSESQFVLIRTLAAYVSQTEMTVYATLVALD
jgi:hypothetical protein